MTDNGTERRVRALIAENLNIPVSEVSDDLGAGRVAEWDSMGHVRLIVALEAEFGRQLDESKLMELETVADMIRVFGSDESPGESHSDAG